PAGSRRWLKIEREVDGQEIKFLLEGSVPSDGDHRKYYRTVAEPTAHFIAAWIELAGQQGLELGGRYRRGAVPPSSRLLIQQRSAPLAAVLMDMNKHSNNFI